MAVTFTAPLKRLAGWAGPALKTATLARRLEEWLPDATEVAVPVALTRRLLCDAAGLATTPWSTHAASVAVLDRFAPTAMALADDAELIDERALREADAVWGGDDIVFEALVEVCGFERVFGRLAVRRNRDSLSKAALLDFGRSATSHEIAQRTGLAAADAALAFTPPATRSSEPDTADGRRTTTGGSLRSPERPPS